MLVEHDESYKIMMNMKKIICDLVVKSVDHISSKHVLIKLTHEEPLPEMFPGQFVEVSMEGVDGVLLRRPISINFVDRTNNKCGNIREDAEIIGKFPHFYRKEDVIS